MRQTSSDLDEALKVGFLRVVSTHPNIAWSIQPVKLPPRHGEHGQESGEQSERLTDMS